MPTHVSGDLRIDPASIRDEQARRLEILVPYTDRSLTRSVLERVPVLAMGLNPRVRLIGVHCVPYQAPFYVPALVQAHLVEQVMDLASECDLPVDAEVVIARDYEGALRHVLSQRSTVLVGSRRHWWRTREESLARRLAREGFRVALLHFE